MTNQPREFWIAFDGDPAKDAGIHRRIMANTPIRPNDYGQEVVHVIEYSALEALQDKLERLEGTCQNTFNQWQKAMDDREALQTKLEKAKAALEFYSERYVHSQDAIGPIIYFRDDIDEEGYGGKRARETLADLNQADKGEG